ncbi:MAG: asparagine synthase (glutamine-hydrolyzing) [Chloroflexi bacterium]|nr:asparagine synthase (glutamine-hydrolyzing) [Chloroflexota bacterium]
MCGIFAWQNFDKSPIDEPLLRRMTDTLRHRGPDDTGYWLNPGGYVGLGHRRLSIIDLSPAGHEPMCNENQTIWLTFNGEIYNFLELRPILEAKGHKFFSQTDAEVIIHAYEEWGVECLQRFNGMWAFALWDENRQRLLVSRDHFGIKPLVYYYDDRRFICGSELKALLADPTVPRCLEPLALHHYLSFMNVPGPYTIYQNIFKLKPGHYLLVENGQVVQQPYWQLKIGPPLQSSDEEILVELETRLQKAVGLQMISDAPLGAFLSGGVDSSLVSALAAKSIDHGSLNTFSVAFTGMDVYDESTWARQVANHVRTNHCEFNMSLDFVELLPDLVKIFDEPFAISSAIPLYLLSRETVKQVKVVLTGDGGDEVFGGYAGRHNLLDVVWNVLALWPLRHYAEPTPQNTHDSIFSRVRWTGTPLSERIAWLFKTGTLSNEVARRRHYLNSLYIFRETEKMALYTPSWAETLNHDYTSELLWSHYPDSAPDRLSRWLALDLQTTLVDEMLSKVDKATMANSLEARVPLLDYTLVEYALRIPARLKVKNKQGKLILKELAEKYVPPEALYRPKHGFNVPLKLWFKNQLFDFVNDILSETAIKQGGYFHPTAVRQILQRHRDQSGLNLSNQIFTLLCFELWRRQS